MTLTEAAFWTRRVGILVIAGIALLILFTFILLNLPGSDPVRNYLKADFACTATKEEFVQEKITIPSLLVAEGSESVYTIETASGKLDQLPLIANVYEYANPGPSLNAQREAKEIAKKLGFNPELLQRRGTTQYAWNEDQYGRRLTVDAATLNFSMASNFNNPEVFPEGKDLPTDDEARTIATGFLRTNGWMLEDYALEKQQVTLINIEPDGSFSMAKSRGDAELIRVDYYRSKPFLTVRSDIDGAEIIKENLQKEYLDYNFTTDTLQTPDGRVDLYNFNAGVFNVDTQKSNISVYVGTKDNRKRDPISIQHIYGVDYTAWILEADPCGTYELISATQVTTIIEEGKGSLVYLNEANGDTVLPYQPTEVSNFSVNQVLLGYLDTAERQRFLQPIYIVIGEATLGSGIRGRFYYYIPAINYDTVQNRIEPATSGEIGGESAAQ